MIFVFIFLIFFLSCLAFRDFSSLRTHFRPFIVWGAIPVANQDVCVERAATAVARGNVGENDKKRVRYAAVHQTDLITLIL
jgi:hypothetical protein